MDKILVNSDKYNGEYVAIKNTEDNTIVGSGKSPQEALDEALKNGIKNPFLLYVPEEGLVHIYYVS